MTCVISDLFPDDPFTTNSAKLERPVVRRGFLKGSTDFTVVIVGTGNSELPLLTIKGPYSSFSQTRPK